MRTKISIPIALAVIALAATFPSFVRSAEATSDDPATESPEDRGYFESVTVTATGSETDTFDTSTAVSVIESEEIERQQADNAADLLRTLPGVDVNGIGTNQPRPIIRGLRGLRVLTMENGLRLNNPRRQTDFGEVPGMIDLDTVDRIEVVRGPASVLYGSDAVGGVLNLVSRLPAYPDGTRQIGGSVGLRYGSADEQIRTHVGVEGAAERFSYRLGGTFRRAEDYDAPDGTFGNVRLAEDTRVLDSAVDEDSYSGAFAFRLAENRQLTLRLARYRADQSGFGLVEPEAIGDPSGARVRITYPFQDFDRYTLQYRGESLGTLFADSVDLAVYHQNNEREFANDIDVSFAIFPGAPLSTVEVDSINFTDLETLGLRAELIKAAPAGHLLTYGIDVTRDDSFNTDFSTTVEAIRFPFPPFETITTTTSDLATAPNATHTSLGVFIQDEIRPDERLKLTLGARYQTVDTKAEATPGWDTTGLDFDDDDFVGSIGVLFEITPNLNLFASHGTAFRAPNIIERLFNGTTPETGAFQVLNPDLKSERSTNDELGLKYRRSNTYMELVYFDNDVDDGIIQKFLTPAEVMALPPDVQAMIPGGVDVVQQQNVDELLIDGWEAAFGYRLPFGLTLEANYTDIDAATTGTAEPLDNAAFRKANLLARYEPDGERYWVEYRLRRNWEQGAVFSIDEDPPLVGADLPAFTVHSLGGGVRLRHRSLEHELALWIENLTDELYAEFSNSSFFRPEPGRNVIASYRLRF